mgnify:CR=1 FL=1
MSLKDLELRLHREVVVEVAGREGFPDVISSFRGT